MAMVQTFPTGSGSGSGSNNGFYKTTDSITATIDATTTLDITNISGLSISDVIIGETIVYDNQGTNAVVTAKDTTNNTIDVKTISTGGTTNYNVDRSGQELLSAYARLDSSWTPSVNSNVPLVLKSGNIIQSSTGLFTIPAGTRVEFIFSTSSNPVGDTSYLLYNNTDSTYLNDIANIDPYKGYNYLNSPVLAAQWTNNTGHSVDISIRVQGSSATSTLIEHTSLSIKEIGRIVDPIQYTANNDELEETPVGNIISYMGNSVPKHHLACDGTEYAIGTYPELEAHIIKEFGSINYFGGDGTTTWAVPDLNGEFLRGTGTNSHANQGNGAAVGVHQDGTLQLYSTYDGKQLQINLTYDDAVYNSDYQMNRTKWIASPSGSSGSTSSNAGHFTSRPTNTSVLYCIKYETTYHVIVPSHMYKVSVKASVSSASGSDIPVVFDNTNIIGDSSLVSGNTFIVPMDGWYTLGMNWSNEGAWDQHFLVRVNGTAIYHVCGIGITDTLYLSKGDVVALYSSKASANSGRVNFCLLTANYKDNIIAGGEVYSEEEQLVGTWTDGKPLYQKTISLQNEITLTETTWTTISTDSFISSIDSLIKYEVIRGDGKRIDMPMSLRINSNKIEAYATVPYVLIKYMTVQYTKTTDQANTYQYKNSLLLTRPDMWEPNTEYDFGGGLYGQRFTGTHSTAGASAKQLLASVSKIVDQGGQIKCPSWVTAPCPFG